MARGKVSEQEMLDLYAQVLERIESGKVTEVTIKAQTADGEIEHTISVATEEEREAAIVALRTVLGRLH